MRDPARIEPTLQAIKAAWQENPDLRLGQLIWAIAGRDPFYVEDDTLVDRAGAMRNAKEKAAEL